MMLFFAFAGCLVFPICCIFALLFLVATGDKQKSFWKIVCSAVLVPCLTFGTYSGWARYTYPDLSRSEKLIHDYGTVTRLSSVSKGKYARVTYETELGGDLELANYYEIKVGHRLTYFAVIEGGSINYFYQSGEIRNPAGTVDWTMPGWSKSLQDLE
jgi:hypothetical protein